MGFKILMQKKYTYEYLKILKNVMLKKFHTVFRQS